MRLNVSCRLSEVFFLLDLDLDLEFKMPKRKQCGAPGGETIPPKKSSSSNFVRNIRSNSLLLFKAKTTREVDSLLCVIWNFPSNTVG